MYKQLQFIAVSTYLKKIFFTPSQSKENLKDAIKLGHSA